MEDLNGVRNASEEENLCYGIVGNIPKEFRSVDLRAMFSNFIEMKGFECFHFRHRPEFRRPTASNCDDKEPLESDATCCIVSISEKKLQDLIKCYHGKNWVEQSGKYLRSKAVISKIKIKEANDTGEEQFYQTRQEKKQNTCTRTSLEFFRQDLNKLPELHPPHLMPNGNVGTPLSVFMELIRTCKLPPCVIKKLGLNFPSSKFKKKYSNVPLDYKSLEKPGSSERRARLRRKKTVSDSTAVQYGSDSSALDTLPDSAGPSELQEERTEHSDNEKGSENEEDSETEEWDRHEALHNDVTSQDRTKERLYEDNIELKWEKGGSGLVFYTDAAFWKQQEEPNFDEETADDWDVDMEIYENPDGGDKDSRDHLQMRLEAQWRKGNDIDLKRVGGFEKHTRGFGGQLMRQQGWTEGASLGSSQLGITVPVTADGQLPKCKRGFGYHGEKLQRHVPKRPRAERNVMISTVYDEPDEQEVNLFESWGPDRLKYISNVEFVRAKKSLPEKRA